MFMNSFSSYFSLYFISLVVDIIVLTGYCCFLLEILLDYCLNKYYFRLETNLVSDHDAGSASFSAILSILFLRALLEQCKKMEGNRQKKRKN